MNAIGSNNVSLKYQRFTSEGCKDIGFAKTEFVAQTQFLLRKLIKILNTYKVLKLVILYLCHNPMEYFLDKIYFFTVQS